MVPIMRLFRNLPALFALVCAATGQGADPIYKKVGDSVVLNPGQPFNAISSATWKHNTDLASEWFGTGNVDCYRDFKDRCSLNKKDGSFTISNLKVEDSGSYTPEINDKVLTALKLQVIKPVPKPTVSVKCNNEKTRCNLTCEANISADVGTVTYEWRTGEEVLSNDKELIITENKESSFICMLKNPVSNSSSDGVDNPLSRGNPGAAAGLAVAIVILIVAPALAVIGRFGWYWFKNRKFPTWKEFWCCGKKKAKGGDSESAEVEKKLLPVNKKSDLEVKTSNDQELNGGWPPETGQNVNENETNISVSGEEHERLYDARETQTSGPTEGEALTSDDEEKGDLHQKPALNSFSVNQGDFSTGEPPFKGSGTNISVSSEKDDLFYPASNTVPSGPTEDNDSSNNDKKTDDQHKEPAEKSSSVSQGDSSTGKQLTTASEGEASPRDNEEKAETNNLELGEGTNQNPPPVNPFTSNPTDQDKDPAEDSSSENQVEQHLDSNPKQTQHANDGTETNNLESAEGTNQNLSSVNPVTIVPTEDNDSSNNDKKKDDQHKESAEKSSSVNQGDSSTGKQLTTASEGEASSRQKDGTNISVSGEEHKQNHPAFDTGTIVPTEDKTLTSNKEEKDDLGPKLPTTSANENPREQHQVFSPEGETRKQSENNKVGDNQQGNQPGFTSETAKAGSEPKTNNHETNGGRCTTTEQNTSKDEAKTSPSNNKEKDDPDQKLAEESSSENQVDSNTGEQPFNGTETNTSKNHEPNEGGPADAVQNVNENVAKTSPSNNKKTDDPDQKPAEESSSENQVDSNTGEQPFNGTENTSETPSGPETSDRGSAV